MDKHELLSVIGELIMNNSNIGADPDDDVMLDELEEVMDNIGPNGTDNITVLFTDGKAIKVTAEDA